jgi:hypothetical protein
MNPLRAMRRRDVGAAPRRYWSLQSRRDAAPTSFVLHTVLVSGHHLQHQDSPSLGISPHAG